MTSRIDRMCFAELARGASDALDNDERAMLAELAISLYAWPNRNPVFDARLHAVADELLEMARLAATSDDAAATG